MGGWLTRSTAGVHLSIDNHIDAYDAQARVCDLRVQYVRREPPIVCYTFDVLKHISFCVDGDRYAFREWLSKIIKLFSWLKYTFVKS